VPASRVIASADTVVFNTCMVTLLDCYYASFITIGFSE
jgi:hypothetical protein